MRRPRIRYLAISVFTVYVYLLGSAHAEQDKKESLDLGNIIITPTRIGESESQISSNISVIGEDALEGCMTNNVADVLNKELGVNVYSASTYKTSKIDIRGFADTAVSNVLVLVDGRKVNSIDMSGPDWLQIPLESIERIEVIRGAASVLYGDNAVGGVINIITKKGRGPITAKIDTSYGSYDAILGDFEVSGSQKDISYYLHSKYYDTQGYRVNSDLLAKDINGRLCYEPLDSIHIDISSGWHKDSYGMPGGLNDTGELSQYGRRGSANQLDNADTDDVFVRSAFDFKPEIDDKKLGILSVDMSYRDRKAYSSFDYGIWGSTTVTYLIDTYGVIANYVYNEKIFDRGFNFLTGVDYYDSKNKIKGGGSGLSASTDDLVITKDEIGYYAYSDVEILPKFFINGGGRYQRAYYKFDQFSGLATGTQKKDPDESVYMTGAKYEYADGSNIHAGIQETFRFLATDEWYNTWTGLNTNLKHQKGIQYEAGIKHNFNDWLDLSVTPYWIDIKDEIYLNPVPAPGINDNYDKTRRKGIEVGSKIDLLKLMPARIFDKIDLSANYTFQEAKFAGGAYSGKYIPMVPSHQAGAGIDLGCFRHVTIYLSGRYTDKRYSINDINNETPRLPGYAVFDGKISYRKDPFEIYFGVNNIFNKIYSSYAVKSTFSNVRDYFPEPERNFYVGALARF